MTKMTKDELYNMLLGNVQQEGGYVRLGFQPILVTNDGMSIYVAAIFESCDDSSPLKVIDKDFNVFDVDDYFGEYTISWLISLVETLKV